MHGVLRLGLATLVVLSHFDHHLAGVNSGIPAVVLFYMLSGYVVTHLWMKHFPPGKGRLAAFYGERFLRIYPQYFVIVTLSGAFVFITKFGSPFATWQNILGNLLIVPLNYFHYADFTVVKDKAAFLAPTGWSLGEEIQAYLVLPLLIVATGRKWIAGILSLAVYALGALQAIEPEMWCYRLLPGTLFMFLAGSAICKTVRYGEKADEFDRHFPAFCWAAILGLLMFSALRFRLSGWTQDTGLGLLIGLPILIWTSQSRIRLPLDGYLGRLSYGLFLAHVPVSWVYEWLHPGADMTGRIPLLFVLTVSLAIAAATTFTVERFVWPLRRRLTSPLAAA